MIKLFRLAIVHRELSFSLKCTVHVRAGEGWAVACLEKDLRLL